MEPVAMYRYCNGSPLPLVPPSAPAIHIGLPVDVRLFVVYRYQFVNFRRHVLCWVHSRQEGETGGGFIA